MPDRSSPMKHRVLVVGVGSIGERHTRCILATGRARVSICETSAELRQNVGQRYAIETTYADLDAALQDAFDVAVICTPAHLHVPMAIKLVYAGMHVLIEKPLSTTLDGLNDLRQAIAAHKVVVGVGYVSRANVAAAELRRRIMGGSIGRPLLINVTTGEHFPTYRPAYRQIYYTDHRTGGGAIQDSLTHQINLCEWLVGPVTRLCADAQHLALEGVDVEDSVNLIARHRGSIANHPVDVSDSIMASYTHNQHQAPKELTVTVVGSTGTLRLLGQQNRLLSMDQPGEVWREQCFGPYDRDANFVNQANRFFDAVEGRAPVLCTLDEGVQTLRVGLCALESVRRGAWCDVCDEAAMSN